jgi:hypothetical protein
LERNKRNEKRSMSNSARFLWVEKCFSTSDESCLSMHNNCGLKLSLSLDTFSSRFSWPYIKSYVIMSERNLNIQQSHSKPFLWEEFKDRVMALETFSFGFSTSSSLDLRVRAAWLWTSFPPSCPPCLLHGPINCKS